MPPVVRGLTRLAALAAGGATCLATVVPSALAAGAPVVAAPGPLASGPSVQGDGPTASTAPGLYVVTLDALPAAAYDGGVPGLAATRPREGVRFDRTRPGVAAYERRLRDQQDRLLDQVGDPRVVYRFGTAVDGFAAWLSSEQVTRLRSAPGVALVERSVRHRVDAASTRSPSAWQRSGHVGGQAGVGRDVVVGVVDSGIWPENAAFSGVPQDVVGEDADLRGFHGACQAGREWRTSTCSDKIVSARWFVAGFGRRHVATSDFLSPRDGVGHGSMVASVAAGDHAVDVTIDGQDLGPVSGVAPAAQLAVYKACWTAPDPRGDGCTTADTVAAIDAAVADGVDVLNYSVSGSHLPGDSVERALLNATTAGVFVTASAGNDGPGARSVRHLAPWVTTVGTSTRSLWRGEVRLGNGTRLIGAMFSDRRVARARLVDAADLAVRGTRPAAARHCEPGSLAATRAEGTVVVCERGGGPRVQKSEAVRRAGGVGMVLLNNTEDPTDGVDADVHAVPTVHLDRSSAGALRDYLRSAAAPAATLLPEPGAGSPPRVSDFSGRGGPNPGVGVKPDLVAPGVGVPGAVVPFSDSDRGWDLWSGSSVSAAQVSGLAATLLPRHPGWSAARVRSALTTTATDLGADPASQGAGDAATTALLDPGLVFDERPRAWGDYLSGETAVADLNLPAVSLGDLVGRRTVLRRLTNVGDATETYTATYTGLPGVTLRTDPASITLAPGRTATVALRFTVGPQAALGGVSTGRLTWRSASHAVAIPLAVRPSRVAAPPQVKADVAKRSVVVRARAATTTPPALRRSVLVPARGSRATLVPGPFDTAAPAAGPSTQRSEVAVPAGTQVVRFQAAPGAEGDDVDLYVYRDDTLVGSATTGTPTVTVTDPAPGAYTAYVNAAAAADATSVASELYTWVVGDSASTTPQSEPLSVVPDPQPGGGPAAGPGFEYSASWDDLDPDRRWLGVVEYAGADRPTLLDLH